MTVHIREPTAAFAGVFQKFHTIDDQRVKNVPENGGIGGEEFLWRWVAQLIRDPELGCLQEYSSVLAGSRQ